MRAGITHQAITTGKSYLNHVVISNSLNFGAQAYFESNEEFWLEDLGLIQFKARTLFWKPSILVNFSKGVL